MGGSSSSSSFCSGSIWPGFFPLASFSFFFCSLTAWRLAISMFLWGIWANKWSVMIAVVGFDENYRHSFAAQHRKKKLSTINQRPYLNLRFDAPEPENSTGQIKQPEGFGWLWGIQVGTGHLHNVTTLTQDEKPIFSLRESFRTNLISSMYFPSHDHLGTNSQR